MLKYISRAIVGAAWPLSALGLYGTGDILFPGSLATVTLVTFAWFFALPWGVGLWLLAED